VTTRDPETMDVLAITSITNFVLASELFFVAGLMVRTPKARLSPAWFWAGAMLALATSALLGGIDHGFVEPAGLSRFWIQRPNWLVMGVVTFCTLMAMARQFLPLRWQGPVLIAGLVQSAVYAAAVMLVGDFLVVIVNYLPVILAFLLLGIRGLGDGTGSWQMVVGVVVLLVATAVQALGIDAFAPLDHDGLYHVIAIAGVPFLYWGGQRLRTA
jgi:hypothetical protein